MTDREVHDLFVRLGAFVVNDHFVYTSGKHGEVYVNKDAITPHACDLWDLAQEVARVSSSHGLDTIIGPAEGSVTLAGFTALALSRIEGREITGAWASKGNDDSFVFRPSFLDLIKGKNVMVVEDILTTGKSARRVVEAVRSTGGTVRMVSALCNRGGITAEQLGVEWLYPLLDFPAQAWPEGECPFCAEGRPINTKLGHGKAYLEAKAATA